MKTEEMKFFICDSCGHKYSNPEEAKSCEQRHKEEIDFDNMKEFELKQVHLDLLKNMYVDWDDCEFGAPCINPKRPYGNSDVEDDIAEIIKFPKKGNWDFEEEMWNEEAQKKMFKLHKEMQIVLQIVLRCQNFKLGKYRKKEEYGQDWILVK